MRFSKIFLLFLIAFTLVGCKCCEDWKLAISSKRFGSKFQKSISSLASSYESGNEAAFMLDTGRALILLNNTSIRGIALKLDILSEGIQKNGIGPYAALIIELAHRLGKNQDTYYQREFTRLLRISSSYFRKPPSKDYMVLIRKRGTLSYYAYSRSAGFAIAKLSLTEFGRKQFQMGHWPSDLTKTLAMVWVCRNLPPDGSAEIETGARKNCELFLRQLDQDLTSSPEVSLGDIMKDLDAGIGIKKFDCFSGEMHGWEMIDMFESYTACLNSELSGFGHSYLDGSTISSNWTGTPPTVNGYTHQQSNEHVSYGPNGNVGTQVNHEYVNDAGEKLTIIHHATIINGEENNGTTTIHESPNGQTSTEFETDNGSVIIESGPESNSVTQPTQSGGSVTTVYNDDTDNFTVTAYDSDGNEIGSATIEQDGSCTGNCDLDEIMSLFTPPDDYIPLSSCAYPWTEDLSSSTLPDTDPLGPYIYPGPDSVQESELLNCITENLNQSTEKCPPSVMLCFEPPPPGICGCGVNSLFPLLANTVSPGNGLRSKPRCL